jgi:hypothetical protein
MPEAAILRERDTAATDSGGLETPVQSIRLYLPSFIGSRAPCNTRVHEFEFRLRYAQACDALNELRHYLRLRSHLWTFKTRFERSQRPNTRARNVIERCTHKIETAAMKYRVAREALTRLSPLLGRVGWEMTLRVLEAKDIRALTEDVQDMDPAARKKSEWRRSEGRQVVSWIWTTPGVAADDDDIGLHDGMYCFRMLCKFI